MIQILGLRTFVNEEGKSITWDKFHERKWRIPRLFDFFKNPEEFIKTCGIPEEERWNLFYTLAHCLDGKREFGHQTVLAFDIDGVGDKTSAEKLAYLAPVAKAIDVAEKDIAVIDSGNGIHFVMEIKEKINVASYFRSNKAKYKTLCDKINTALAENNLPGTSDTSIFEPRRILRLPGTLNKKPNKPEKTCTVIHLLETASPIDNPLKQDKSDSDSGEKTTSKKKPKTITALHLTTDKDGILQGCNFLKWAKGNQAKVSEPQWYAALSILGRLEDGKQLAHEYSHLHPSYSRENTDEKLAQALEKSGPRTCEAIEQLWPSCTACPHYKKIQSPIQIETEEVIYTEKTGFHKTFEVNGVAKRVPDYEGLRRFFYKQTPYVVLEPSKIVYAWTGTHYKETSYQLLEVFAEKHFKPSPDTKIVNEFKNKLLRTNPRPIEWFTKTNSGKMNFTNGVLDISSGILYPSNKEIGFRNVIPYAYDSNALAPKFTYMLTKIFQGDESLSTLLKEFIGYAISGDTYWLHKALVMVGDGSNGKSTILNIIKKLVGSENYSAMRMVDLASEYHRQVLDGKLFNLTEEANHKSFYDTSILKSLVGGAGVQVRAPYGLPYTIVNTAKMILTCNEMPPNWDNTSGMARRLIILPFLHEFKPTDEDYNPRIDQELEEELPGILNMCVEAYRNVIANNGFTEAQAAMEAAKNYTDDNNVLKMWVAEEIKCQESSDVFTTVGDLYAAYKIYADKNGFKFEHITRMQFSKRLRKYIPDYKTRHKKLRIKETTPWVLMGISCAPDAGDGLAN